MPAVIFPGPEGRLEGRFQPATRPRAPVAMILHPHPQAGGTMNDRITQALYKTFVARGFATLRFNFRGVGRSQGSFDNGIGELSDGRRARLGAVDPPRSLDHVDRRLQLRRADRHAVADAPPGNPGFISVAPPANMYDFSFLAPCPASGIIVQGNADTVVTPNAVQKLVDKLRTQKHITIHHDEIPRANHFFENELDDLMKSVDNYLDMRLSPDCPIK
jgi:alpha/beta superfamily hydrolase